MQAPRTRALGALAAAAASLALSGCVIVTGDDDADFDFDRDDQVFLIASYDAIEDGNHAFFYHQVLPELSMEHPATNAGNVEFPWFCFVFEDAIDADYARRRVGAMDGGASLAEQMYIEETCSAG